MSPEAWGFFSVLTTVGSATLVELVRTRKKVERSAAESRQANTTAVATATTAAEAATEAADLARPVGNGFAPTVIATLGELKAGLSELKEGQKEIREKIDRHIEDHASADVGARRRRN